ncbi:uncharacterized protein T551_00168 [Pneumocystis jirovecii RU7]|uniref:Membrane insertase YidC/Oxa/ALB C-terminal domain-containing protein n=1 Tax=Pneumocystis jirovecii (strain RU7) TaxID=1408657 RepID=A0A0W4ZWC5_PNEJ7|nr:uncharacterized protein T551_00168 [Pneumocystis jirovecii RU7]KTW32683.1 hypothetical protein T551_00168 [Pneumocystis jirovecii RU7]
MYQTTIALHRLPLHLTHRIYRFLHTTSSCYNLFALGSTALYTVHGTGVPWWAAIPLTTLLIRSVMLPVVFWSRNRMIRYARIKPLIKAWEFQYMKLSYFDSEKIKKLNQKRNELFHRHSCHPIGSLVLPLVQIPLFFIMTFVLRGMSGSSFLLFSGLNVPVEVSLAHEGIGWIQDLTVSDPIGFLPVCLGLISLINIQLNLDFYKEMVSVPIFLTRLAQGNALVFTFVSMQAPTALSLYWVTSSLFSVIQNLVLHFVKPLPYFPRHFKK